MSDNTPNSGVLPLGYQSWWLSVAGNLGGVYPFYDSDAPSAAMSLDIAEVINARRARGEPVQLDAAGLVTKAMFPYLLGDRTLISGIRRAPWMASPQPDGQWRKILLPPHGNEKPDPDEFTEQLKVALINEARGYVGDSKVVGILLSGGMDSRVIAGVLREVQLESDNTFQVVGLTWGKETSRDVIYAQRVVERFDWEWQHFPITAETLRDNIRHVADIGAEVSPLHLHAMPQVASLSGIDVVLAGSYGDSVGRAEFSGRRLTELRPILPRRPDRFAVVRSEALKQALPRLQEDAVNTPWLRESSGVNSLRHREIEQEMHYMRRMLQSCMLLMARNKRFCQLFTAPEVFGLMWRLDPAMRGDDWYRRLLPQLPGDLLEIPWARTGRRYGQSEGPADNHAKEYHQYGTWLRGELRDEVLARVNSERIRGLGVFNPAALDYAVRSWRRADTTSTNALDELVAWLAGLHDFLELHHIGGCEQVHPLKIRETARSLIGGAHARLYIEARERLRG